MQEFGDSARARKLYEAESDDDDDDEIEPNPKLEQGKFLCIISTYIFGYLSHLCMTKLVFLVAHACCSGFGVHCGSVEGSLGLKDFCNFAIHIAQLWG